jgi:hypothetical protein
MTIGRATTLPVDRSLMDDERNLLYWLLRNGFPGAEQFLPQVDQARVIGRCSCGCPSIDLAVEGVGPDRNAGMVSLSDWLWPTQEGLFGVVLFATDRRLACLDVWSVDGRANPSRLPCPDKELVPYEAHPA